MTAQRCLFPAVLLLLFASPVAAQRRPPPTAEAAFAEFETASRAALTVLNDRARATRLAPVEREALLAASAELAVALGEKFLADHPGYPGRWSVVATMLRTRREFHGEGAAPRRAAWLARRAELRGGLLAATDVPEGTTVSVLELEVLGAIGGRWAQPGEPADLVRAAAFADMLGARFPASDRRKFAEGGLLEALTPVDPKAAEVRLRRLASGGDVNPALTQLAEGRLRVLALRETPLELKFTALDGSEVDLAKLRGKVVLIDFWATWCVPCMQEMPTVIAAYEKFHSRGFEVIGISFDRAPGSTPRAMDKSPEQLKQFLVEQRMPWPQHYDGRYWDNELGRRFAIRSLPSTFLLGRDGRLVTTETHGDKLAAEIERQLGL